MEDLDRRITEQGNLVRSLKSSKADKDKIAAEVATLKALKAEREALAPSDKAAPASGPSTPKPDDKKAKGSFTLKNAKVQSLVGCLRIMAMILIFRHHQSRELNHLKLLYDSLSVTFWDPVG